MGLNPEEGCPQTWAARRRGHPLLLAPWLHVQGRILARELLPVPHHFRAIPLAAVPPSSLSRVQDGDSAGMSPAWGLSWEGEMLLLVVVQKGGGMPLTGAGWGP